MRTLVAVVAFFGGIVALNLAAREPAAAQGFPQKGGVGFPPPEQAKWEYGTLSTAPQFVGKAADRTGPPFVSQLVWTTGAKETVAANWRELAEQLKVKVKDEDAPTRVIRVAILNHLGADGWELVCESGTSFTFKRRVP